MIGKKINQYLVLERLGAGETANVFKAQDTKLDRLVLMKVISVAENDTDSLTAFKKEARAGLLLSHPNISSIFDVIDDESGRYLIYEYLPGGTLRDRIQRAVTSGELIPIDRCVDYVLCAAQGLAEAHRHGVVHRDVCAENIVVTPTHAVKVTNFCKARFDDGPTFAGSASLTAAFGAFVPERLQGATVDHRGDIYSLCALLFELLTGEKAFRAKNAAAHLQEIMYNPVPQMSEIRPGISDGLQKIVEKGMSKKPEDRFSNMDLLIDALRAEQRDGMQSQEPLPEEPSIAVIPLVALGGGPELVSFCDGLTEEIAFQLQSVQGLQVAATTSAARFKGKTEDLRKVGAQLNVNLILEGNARTAGTLVRVILKLTDAGSGYQIWTQRFDRDLKDVLAIQDEVAQTVSNVLVQRVAGNELPTAQVPAVTGMTGQFVTTMSLPAPVRALVMSDILLAARGLLNPVETFNEAIRTALQMPPSSIDAQIALGYAYAVLGKSPGLAEQGFRKALDIEPNNTDAIIGYATHVLAAEGRILEAKAMIMKADTTALPAVLAAGWIRFWSGDFDGAVALCRHAFKIDANVADIYLLLARAYAALGQFREAIIAAGRGRLLAPEDPRIAATLSYSYGRSGQADEANRLADELGTLAQKRYVSVLDVAMPYAGLGLGEWVSCCLERAKEERPVEYLWWNQSPEWRDYR